MCAWLLFVFIVSAQFSVNIKNNIFISDSLLSLFYFFVLNIVNVENPSSHIGPICSSGNTLFLL
jgi:hypothetical protein